MHQSSLEQRLLPTISLFGIDVNTVKNELYTQSSKVQNFKKLQDSTSSTRPPCGFVPFLTSLSPPLTTMPKMRIHQNLYIGILSDLQKFENIYKNFLQDLHVVIPTLLQTLQNTDHTTKNDRHVSLLLYDLPKYSYSKHLLYLVY